LNLLLDIIRFYYVKQKDLSIILYINVNHLKILNFQCEILVVI
jgi:hypothetical protein